MKDIGPIAWGILVVAFFLAGFAAADILLFKGATMPSEMRPYIGWIVCVPVGVYCASLFIKQNPKPKG